MSAQQTITQDEGQAPRWRLYVEFALDARRNANARRQMSRELPEDHDWCAYNALQTQKAYERARSYLRTARNLRENY
jgi:hypothetical protein